MSIVQGAAWMTATAAQFQTKVSVVLVSASSWQQVLKADARRWFVEFAAAPGFNFIWPPFGAGQLGSGVQTNSNNGPLQYKWWDAPSLVTGAWFADPGANTQYIITEVLYVGP